jgi:hypothetical protein
MSVLTLLLPPTEYATAAESTTATESAAAESLHSIANYAVDCAAAGAAPTETF